MARYYESNTSGMNFDRFLENFDESTLVTMKRHYWTAKQMIRNKMGKKEDDHLLASDSDLDSKLTLFRSVRDTSYALLACIENYQGYMYDVVEVEKELSDCLKARGKKESREEIAKAMRAVARAIIYSAVHRCAIRKPLIRFYNELHVFAERAIHDCQQTVDAAERARTEYRGSLLWMKKVSEEVDPESHLINSFREAQNTVRQTKERLDKLKVDVMQKVDLLSASRSNLLSHLFGNYLQDMGRFYWKTSQVYAILAENLSAFQHYEFEILTDLIEPSKRVAKRVQQSKSLDSAAEDNESSLYDPSAMSESNYSALIKITKEEKEQAIKNLFGRASPEADKPTEEEERPDSPLGIMSDDQEHLDEQGPVAQKFPTHIGPLPASLIDFNATVPKLAPPPMVAPNDQQPSTSNNGLQQPALLTLEDMPSDDYMSQQLFPMMKKSQKHTPKKEENSLLDLLNLQVPASGASFPNPFGDNRSSEWDLLLSQCDGQQQSEDLL